MTVQAHLGLLYDEHEPMENDDHRINANFYLVEPLENWLAEQGRDAFVSSNSTVDFDPDWHPVGPDFYVVLGGKRKNHKKWVVRKEGGLKPNLVVEMLSDSTKEVDRGKKKDIYRDMLEVGDYVLYDSDAQRIEAYRLVRGEYVQVPSDAEGLVKCSTLPLRLGIHAGELRFFTLDGVLLPTANERAAAERQRANAERTRAEAERTRAEAERLRADTEQAKAAAEQAKAEAERVRADAEQAKAEAERLRADTERARAEAAERRLRELEERLRQLDPPDTP